MGQCAYQLIRDRDASCGHAVTKHLAAMFAPGLNADVGRAPCHVAEVPVTDICRWQERFGSLKRLT